MVQTACAFGHFDFRAQHRLCQSQKEVVFLDAMVLASEESESPNLSSKCQSQRQ
jgi:hypothetical protein